jgi:hypothetical protein
MHPLSIYLYLSISCYQTQLTREARVLALSILLLTLICSLPLNSTPLVYVCLSNIMATGNLGMKLNLLELALKLKNAAYNPKVLARDDVLD